MKSLIKKAKEFLNFLMRVLKYPQLWQKSKRDFKLARGKQHLELLKKIKPKIEKDLKKKIKEIKEIKKKGEEVLRKREDELKREASKFLIEGLDKEVEGIGPILKEKIVRSCFKGHLDDLKNAIYFVKGIGYEKQYHINKWIEKKKEDLLQMVFGELDFPKKKEIIKKYQEEILKIQEKLNIYLKEMKEVEFLKKKTEKEIERLEKVKPLDFFRLYFESDENLNKKVQSFVIGVFPEWKPIPKWFKRIIQNYAVK